MTVESYCVRVKGRTYGYTYIRRGSQTLQLRKNATRFPTKSAAAEYVKRYVDIPCVIEASGAPAGNPKYNRRT